MSANATSRIRRSSIALVLALGVSVTTCRLDKLINPATSDRVVVNPDSVRASANVGSLESKDTTLHIASADGVALTWNATTTAAWVTLTPSADSLIVKLHPDTLSQTLHIDSIVFTAPGGVATATVPIVFDMLPPAAELGVSPANRDTAARVGSVQPDTFSLRIKNKGALPLTWTATFNATWVTLSDSGGTVPAQDTTSTVVLVTLRPDTLSAGAHSGRIVFTAPGAIGAPDTVPITYRIDPCAETVIPTLDATRSGSITLSDCGAPHRAGRQAKLYSVQAVPGDTLSFRLTGFDTYLVLTDSLGTVLKQNDDCSTPAGPACILEHAVTAAGRYVVEATTAAAGATGAFTLSVVKERAPSPPASIGQYRGDSTTAIGVGVITNQNVVVLKGMVSDPNPGDSVHLMTELVGAGSGTRTDSSAFVSPSGAAAAVRAATLVENESYYWRARACDKTSRCSAWVSFGGNVDPASDFRVNAVLETPDAPTLLDQVGPNGSMGVGQGTGGVVLSTQTVTFQGTVTDPDPGDLIAIQVEWKQTGTAFDSTSNLAQGSGVPAGGTATVGQGFTVGLGTNYHWRARACDQTGRCSGWVSFGGNLETDVDFHVP